MAPDGSRVVIAAATRHACAVSVHTLVDRFFAADGPLAKRLPGYAPRTAQIEMAHAVCDTLAKKSGRLVVEAGTGVGKSLAYLAPALLANKKVLVTTATKALQDQLYTKDVPLAWACAREILKQDEHPHDAVLVKGRQNYLCKLRFEHFAAQPLFVFPGDVVPWPKLVQWAHNTSTGDRADVEGLPEPFSTWSELDAGSEHCLGTACMHHEACFVTQMKRHADSARLVVANHHLLCADLRVRAESKDSSDKATASVLPLPDAYVLDEAHTLPDVASDWFGVELSSMTHERLLVDARRFADSCGGDERARVLDACFAAEDKVHRLWARLRNHTSAQRERVQLGPDSHAAVTDADDALRDLSQALDGVGTQEGAEAAMAAAAKDAIARRVLQARSDVAFVLSQPPHDDRFLVVGELVGARQQNAQVTATPVDIAAAIQRTILALPAPVVFTSATLAVGGSTRAFRSRIGIADTEVCAEHCSSPEVDELVLASPFDFAKRAALYAPTGMPEPDHPSYPSRFIEEARFLLELVSGGALFLFTSHAAMEQGFATLAPLAQTLGITARKQGDAQKRALLQELRDHDQAIGMLLCATHSFWEGVDVRGRALRLVCIDRLPFKVPTDPVRKARAELVKKRGGDAFADIAVAEAALALKQGAGRLLRDVDDAGIVAILDGRLRTRSYGPVLLRTLPPMTRIGARKPLADFFSRFVQPALGLSPHAMVASTTRALA